MKLLSKKVSIRSQMVKRSWYIIIFMLTISAVITAQIIYIQTFKKDELLSQVDNLKAKERTIYANRGNIFTSDGKSLLATTVPKFVVAFDASHDFMVKDTIKIRQKGKPDSLVIYAEEVEKLSHLLAENFREKTAKQYKQIILSARKENRQYVRLVKRMIDVKEFIKISNFPFFKEDKRLVGGILTRKYIREYPFGKTAKRTIGNVLDNNAMRGSYGIEYSFNEILAGKNGYGFYDNISGGYWRAVEARSEVQPEAGQDIVTTLDVNFQDIAETALLRQVIATRAKYGTVVVMEIQTGEIKAIANYGQRSSSGGMTYVDNKNYAVTEGTDPGSTFKLASMLALLEKTTVGLDDFAVNCEGSVQHSRNITMTCSHRGGHGNLTVGQVFEQSCNVGIYQLIKKHFGFKRSSDFFEYIAKFKLNQGLDFQLKGESLPIIISPEDKQLFSHTTIPWTSIGYEMQLTPLQTLCFYNAVANNGYWVEPMLVKEVRQANEVKQTFSAKTSFSPICSVRSVRLAKKMLEGVVANGTASNISEGYCRVAGKTGTAQKISGGYRQGTEMYTSFVGYFPADNPKYSCIVAIDEPKDALAYGSTTAAPVFREIADKIFAYDVSIHPAKKIKTNVNRLARRFSGGEAADFKTIAAAFGMDNEPDKSGWLYAKSLGNSQVAWQSINQNKKELNVKGLVLRDALHLLENAGYSVAYEGKGKVAAVQVVSYKQVALLLK